MWCSLSMTLRRCGTGGDPWQRPPAALHSDIVVGELASQSCFSPSSLESYLACPFAWFLGRVVGVEEPSSGVDARLVGTLVHAAVGSVYRGLIAQGTGPLRHDALTVATAEACAVVDERVTGEGFPGTPAEKRVVAGRAKQLAGELLRMEASDPAPLRPLLVEADVGGAMGVDIGGVRVRGRMDRVDVDPVDGSLFVVDYKTGAAPSPGKIGSKEALQLPLYLLALEAEGTPSVKGGAYLSPATRKKAGVVLLGESDTAEPPSGCRGLTPEQADALYQEVRTLVQEAAAGITTGRIAPLPDRTCPSWCDLGSACRSRRGARRP